MLKKASVPTPRYSGWMGSWLQRGNRPAAHALLGKDYNTLLDTINLGTQAVLGSRSCIH